MRRMIMLCMALGVSAGCQRSMGYARPKHRNIEAIGSPAVGVGTQGLDHGPREPSAPHDSFPVRPQFTDVGRIVAPNAMMITLQRPTGDELRLNVKPLTSILVDGHPSNANSLPEGAEARASYVVDGDQTVAERVEVQTRPPAHKKPAVVGP
jgi:hypothetical protein